MNRYTVSLTVTDETDNRQLIGVTAPHLTGKEARDIIVTAMNGIIVEPEPPILTVPKPKKPKWQLSRTKNKKLHSAVQVEPPRGFKPKELDDV